ncbi:hypothetical protein N5D61_03540 [Pseudomonas sp. GD03842]|uniref:hypothetical protein n=1 Tax=Pseudomonas sp. GD03842 TaxID=2975385 RepID=UPI00244815EC|nr:hypothetical protein [Pseudomonas sp. GD03842]MDH0745418.1 hypothetical protein [Pseudomonas sp. GD03842]
MQPEHLLLQGPVFLPVTAETCERLKNEGVHALDPLSEPELAAVLVIQNLAQASENELTCAAAEKVLGRLLAWSVAQGAAAGGLLAEARRLFDARQLYFGLNAIKGLNLRLLLEEEVAARDYLLADGQWDLEYKTRHHRQNDPFSERLITPRYHERWLSAAQDKLVRTFRANLDEDLHVQGYAGIGKSHLLGVLMECLPPARTLLLARTPGKLAALRERLKGAQGKGKGPGSTFKAFAQALLNGPRFEPERVTESVPSKQALAQTLNILGFRDQGPQATLDLCLKVLECYCQSWEHSLAGKHLPHFNLALSPLEQQVLLEYASRLWVYLDRHPEWGSQTGFEALWMLKRANLNGCAMPDRYSHVLVDESQDIAPALLQIIERGKQVLITLGDEYQHPGRAMVKRGPRVRQTDISYSVRSGRNVERLVNPLIHQHSEKGKLPFEGARDADVGIEQYPEGFVPPEGCVILTASPWDMMKWAVELHAARCAFGYQDAASQRDFEHFMNTAVGLFKPDFYAPERSALGLHAYFSDMTDWQRVRAANRFDEAFLWVEQRLDQGFNMADVTRLSRLSGDPSKRCVLMRAEEAGGMEFEQVLLTPELLTNVKFKDAYDFDQRICAVYIAISRATRQLYVPYDVVEWIEYHNYQKFRESHGY